MARVCNFRGAKLKNCNARGADFSYADFRGADLRRADLDDALFVGADLTGANLEGANLLGTNLNSANLRGAILTNIVAWGVSAMGVDTDRRTKQSRIYVPTRLAEGGLEADPLEFAFEEDRAVLRTPGFSLCVDDLASASFLSLLSTIPRVDWLMKSATSRMVLLLGRFEGKRADVLFELQKELMWEHGYVGIIFDFDPPRDRDLIETITTLAGLSSFIIADLTDARSVMLEATVIIPNFEIPFVPILHRDETEPTMFDSLRRRYSHLLKPVVYSDTADIKLSLKNRIIKPVRKELKRIRESKSN